MPPILQTRSSGLPPLVCLLRPSWLIPSARHQIGTKPLRCWLPSCPSAPPPLGQPHCGHLNPMKSSSIPNVPSSWAASGRDRWPDSPEDSLWALTGLSPREHVPRPARRHPRLRSITCHFRGPSKARMSRGPEYQVNVCWRASAVQLLAIGPGGGWLLLVSGRRRFSSPLPRNTAAVGRCRLHVDAEPPQRR